MVSGSKSGLNQSVRSCMSTTLYGYRFRVRVHVFMVMIGDRAAGKKPVCTSLSTGFKKQQILKADFNLGTRHSKREINIETVSHSYES